MNISDCIAKSRGRPRSEEKRREIMQAATELFTEKGYVGTSVDDIAALAGVSKQTVYSHYGSKEALFGLAVSTRCKNSGFDQDTIDPAIAPEIMLPQIARSFVGLVLSREAMRVYRVCTGSAETHPELGQLFYKHGPLQTVQVVSQYLAAQNEVGTLHMEDPEQAAWQFLCMLKAEGQMRVQFKMEHLSEAELNTYIENCVAMFLRAYSR